MPRTHKPSINAYQRRSLERISALLEAAEYLTNRLANQTIKSRGMHADLTQFLPAIEEQITDVLEDIRLALKEDFIKYE